MSWEISHRMEPTCHRYWVFVSVNVSVNSVLACCNSPLEIPLLEHPHSHHWKLCPPPCEGLVTWAVSFSFLHKEYSVFDFLEYFAQI